jgi:hypothetical protein
LKNRGQACFLAENSKEGYSNSFLGHFLGHLSLNLEILSGFLYNLGLIVEY